MSQWDQIDLLLSLSESELDSQLRKLPPDQVRSILKGMELRASSICPKQAKDRLDLLCRGEGTRQDVIALVAHHWPDAVLDTWQADLIKAILSARHCKLSEVAIKGCTKAGKGFSVALAACLWFQSSDECKVIITSQRHRHAHDVMYAEVLRNRKRMRNACEGDNGDTRIKASEQKYIVTASPESGEGFSGQHGPATMFIFDEATSCSEEYWDQSATQSALSVAISNPRTMSGWFRRLFPSGSEDQHQVMDIPGQRQRYLLTVGGADCLNVRAGRDRGDELIPEQITADRYAAIMAHPNPQWRRVMGEGRFPEQDLESTVIAYAWLDRHQRAWRAGLPCAAFALDVAASEHGDRSILAGGSVAGVAFLAELQRVDTMQVVAWVMRQAADRGVDLSAGSVPIAVDMDGLGKGVGDRLAEVGCWVVEVRGNAKSEVDAKTYANLRAEMYGELGQRLDPRGPYPDEPWALPMDSEMEADLVAPERIYKSDGFCWGITPKSKPTAGYKGDTLRAKLGRSPDRGDTVAYLWLAVRRLLKWNRATYSGPLLCSDEEDEGGEDIEWTPFMRELLGFDD